MRSLARCGLPGSTVPENFSPGEALGARVIVAIDEEADRFGQWPWPRTLVGSFFDRIAASRPRDRR